MEILPYIISLLSLTIVIIQFAIKRKDEKITFLNNKKFEIYTKFLRDFGLLQVKKDIMATSFETMENEGVKFLNYSDEELSKMNFMENIDFRKAATQMIKSLSIVADRDVDLPQFILLASPELIDEVKVFKSSWYNFQQIFHINAEDYSNAYNFKLFVSKFNRELNNTRELTDSSEKSYNRIIILMRKELGIK